MPDETPTSESARTLSDPVFKSLFRLQPVVIRPSKRGPAICRSTAFRCLARHLENWPRKSLRVAWKQHLQSLVTTGSISTSFGNLSQAPEIDSIQPITSANSVVGSGRVRRLQRNLPKVFHHGVRARKRGRHNYFHSFWVWSSCHSGFLRPLILANGCSFCRAFLRPSSLAVPCCIFCTLRSCGSGISEICE